MTFSSGELALLDARTGRKTWVELQAAVNGIAFDTSSVLVATGADDGCARVYRMADGTEVGRMPLGEKVLQVQFERDGWLKATTYTFDTYLLEGYFRWSLEPTTTRDLIAAACGRLTRNLTADEWSNDVGGTYRETRPELAASAAKTAAQDDRQHLAGSGGDSVIRPWPPTQPSPRGRMSPPLAQRMSLAHAHWRARGHAAGAADRSTPPAGRLATPPAGPRRWDARMRTTWRAETRRPASCRRRRRRRRPVGRAPAPKRMQRRAEARMP